MIIYWIISSCLHNSKLDISVLFCVWNGQVDVWYKVTSLMDPRQNMSTDSANWRCDLLVNVQPHSTLHRWCAARDKMFTLIATNCCTRSAQITNIIIILLQSKIQNIVPIIYLSELYDYMMESMWVFLEYLWCSTIYKHISKFIKIKSVLHVFFSDEIPLKCIFSMQIV